MARATTQKGKTAKKKTARRKTGPKAFAPTPEQRAIVSAMGLTGSTAQQIARAVINEKTGKHISLATLYRHFKPELEQKSKAMEGLAVGVVAKIMGDDKAEDRDKLRAAMFWLNTQCGYATQKAVEHKNRPPAELANLGPDDLRRIARNLQAAAKQYEERPDPGSPSINDPPAGHA